MLAFLRERTILIVKLFLTSSLSVTYGVAERQGVRKKVFYKRELKQSSEKGVEGQCEGQEQQIACTEPRLSSYVVLKRGVQDSGAT